MVKKIGIDLGTANTKICIKGKGIVLREPTAVAFDVLTGEIIASGTRAKKMLGKTPPEKEVVLPMKGGVIADFEDCAEMLVTFLYKLGLRGILTKPKIAVSVPYGITEVERNAFENVCVAAAGRDVFRLVKEPMAAALGSGTDILKTKGSLICDIGAGNTQTSVISYRGIVSAGMKRIGGDNFDISIVRYVKNMYGVEIGKPTAELVKKTIGCAHPAFDRGEFEIYGRNCISGQNVVRQHLRSGEVREAITEDLNRITEHIRSVLESIPPELSADVFDTGLVLAGGSALLPGTDRFISDKIGMPVVVSKHPLDCTCRGLQTIIESSGELIDVVCMGDEDE